MRRTNYYEPKRTRGFRVVKQCEGCLLVDDSFRTCASFLDPGYQHRDGRKCWGRCDSVKDMVKRLQDIDTYAGGGDSSIKAELNRWMEKAKIRPPALF